MDEELNKMIQERINILNGLLMGIPCMTDGERDTIRQSMATTAETAFIMGQLKEKDRQVKKLKEELKVWGK